MMGNLAAADMEWWVEVLLGGLGFLVCLLPIAIWGITIRRMKQVHKKSTQELEDLIAKPGAFLFYRPALEELRKRNEDLSPALPNLVDLCLDKRSFLRKIGWNAIVEFFPGVASEIPFDPTRTSEEAKDRLTKLRDSFWAC